jgi:tRNA(fMet)-specific endonuclease VapC
LRYLLDANVVVALLRRRIRRAMLARLEAHPPGDAVTSVVVAHELYYGAAWSDRPDENRRQLAAMFADLLPLPLTREDAEAAGDIRARLRTAGTPIGPYDVLIAGQAMARGLVLVTNNTREFVRVGGLETADWLGVD